jgi:DNA-binding transcriptional ArsR family regulator
MTFKQEQCPAMEGLSDQALIQVAQYFSALAEPSRLRILNCLRDHEQNVGELAEHCDCSQANVSRHLSTLAKHGLVVREGRGTSVYYRIADPAIYALCDLVCGNVARQLEAQAAALGGRTKSVKAR